MGTTQGKRTYVSQVYDVLTERFYDEQPFTLYDIIKVIPWVEEERDRDQQSKSLRMTSRVSASLVYLGKIGATVIVDITKDGRNIYMANKDTLKLYKPKIRKHCRTHTQPRRYG